MTKSSRLTKTSLNYFPSINGLVIDQGRGNFVEIKSDPVPPCPEFPQGIRFSLTLRNAEGVPLLQYVMANNNGLQEPIIEHDLCVYIRGLDRDAFRMVNDGTQHVFESVSEMLNDFFSNVDVALKSEGEPA